MFKRGKDNGHDTWKSNFPKSFLPIFSSICNSNVYLQHMSSSKIFYCPFQGGTSFVDLLCFCSVLCLLCLCVRLFICALWSPAGKGLTSWLSFVVSNCEFVTFPLVSWVGCGT